MLANLQALRALAAIAVVVFHVATMPGTGMPFSVGASGVDIFFVLSGFIIAYSSSRDDRNFLHRRLIRILPAYWIATLIAALFTLENMALADALDWLVQSLFYLPEARGRPVLIFVAWTLVYELAFYLLYWLALRLGARRAPWAALAVLPVLALMPLPGVPRTWPLFLEFALGIVIYLGVERYDLSRRIGKRLALTMAGLALLAMPVLPHLLGPGKDDCDNIERVVTWGLPAACIVLGAIVAEREGFAIRNRMIQLLGAASYAIYLLHPVAIGQLLKVPPIAPPLSWATCLAASAAAVMLGVAFYLWVETPLRRRLRPLIGDHAPSAGAARLPIVREGAAHPLKPNPYTARHRR